MGDKTRGLYGKFNVSRVDGKDAPGEKHHGCRYFVLDLDHDPHGRIAALAYARSAEADGYGMLAANISSLVQSIEVSLNVKVNPSPSRRSGR